MLKEKVNRIKSVTDNEGMIYIAIIMFIVPLNRAYMQAFEYLHLCRL